MLTQKSFDLIFFVYGILVSLYYGNDPVSWFQKEIRGNMIVLTDHISKYMSELNLIRCRKIPKRPVLIGKTSQMKRLVLYIKLSIAGYSKITTLCCCILNIYLSRIVFIHSSSLFTYILTICFLIKKIIIVWWECASILTKTEFSQFVNALDLR